jgi:multicomponent Na+:H+ antiporter subunit B
MRSLILATATRYLLPLMLMLSIFILFRGHNEPGGGFEGGLIAAAALILYAFAYSVEQVLKIMPIHPRTLIPVGLLIAVSSALVSLFLGQPFMTSQWGHTYLPIIGKPSTPLLFDIGVYLVVIGVTLTIILTLAEE